MPSTKKPAKPTGPLGRRKVPKLGEFSSTKKFQIYHGTGPPDTHTIIKESSILNDGVCLNIFQGFDKIKKSFDNLERLSVPIFMDNGSFERFKAAYGKTKKTKKSESGEEGEDEPGEMEESDESTKGKKKKAGKQAIKIPLPVYHSEPASIEYFDHVTTEYEKLIKSSRNPQNLIITVPEVIANADITKKLQAKYLPVYKKWQDQYGFKMIVSLQFNSHEDTWEHEMMESAKFIAENVDPNNPNVQRVGMPFGNDFKPIQNKEKFKKVNAMFKLGGPLQGYGAHLFAAGMPIKVLSFTGDWVDSVDSSTLNNMAKYAHYLSKEGYYFDIRDIQGRPKSKEGKPPSKEIVDKIWEIMYSEGIDPNKWMEAGTPAFNARYRMLVENFDTVVARAKTWYVPKEVRPPVPVPVITMPPELPPAIAVTTRAGGAMRSSNNAKDGPRKWNRLLSAIYLWNQVFGNGSHLTARSARQVLKDKFGHGIPYSNKEIEEIVKMASRTAMEFDYIDVGGYFSAWPVEELFRLYIDADLHNKARLAVKLVRNVSKLEKIINKAKINMARMK